MLRYAINTITENPFAPSGAQGYYFHLIDEMRGELGSDERLYVFCSTANKHVFASLFSENVVPVIFPFSNERQILRVLTEHIAFPGKITSLGIDIYNCGNLAPGWVPSRCRVVSTNKTMHAFTKPGSMSFLKETYRILLGKRTARRSDLVISNSESNTNDIVKYLPVPRRKIRLVYEALDHQQFFPNRGSQANQAYLAQFGLNAPFILFVSSFYKYKNAEALIRAFSMLKDRESLQLALVGYSREQDYFQFLKGLVRELQLEGRVVFAGGVSLQETARFYQAAKVFVYPSKYETFGLTILEAMACGCPVITSNVSSMPEIGGDAALYFDPENVHQLVDHLEATLSGKEAREQLIQRGLRRAAEFTWKKTAQQTLQVFREVAGLQSGMEPH